MNAPMNAFSITAPASAATYANAFRIGHALGAGATPRGANAMTGTDGPGEGLSGRIAALDPAQRAVAGRRAEILGAVGQGLAGLAPGQRRAALDHITPALVATGVPADAIAAFDPTDENLAAVVAEARSLTKMLAPP
jgi:hypothetical protein